MAQQTVALQIKENAQPITLVLDDAHYTQTDMLKHLSQGRPFDHELSALLIHLLKSGDGFIDVGAHIGYFSLLASVCVGAAGRVVAMEPEPGNYAHLIQHRELNQLQQLTGVNAAVSDASGTATFFANSDNDGGHALWDPGLHPSCPNSAASPKPFTVQTTTIDDIVRSHFVKPPKLMKVDTEGAEVKVLTGARQTLANRLIPFIVCELNAVGLEQMKSSMNEMRALMLAHGYHTFVLQQHGRLPLWVPPEVALKPIYVTNILFTLPELLGAYWKEAVFGEGAG